MNGNRLYYKNLVHNLIKEQDMNDKVFSVGTQYEKAHPDLNPLNQKADEVSAKYYKKDKPLHKHETILYNEVVNGRTMRLVPQVWYDVLVSKDCGVLDTDKPYLFNQVFMNATAYFAKKAHLLKNKKVQERLKKPLLL